MTIAMPTSTIYVSGPIKGHPDFLVKFAAASDEVAEWATPLNPTSIGSCETLPCRNPGELLATGHTWECYMRFDIEKLVHCDGIYMMRGWETSQGARTELAIAQTLGLSVHFQPDTDSLTAMLVRQRAWSSETFGPGDRLNGVLAHIRKELDEIEADPTDVTEWIDVVILAFDGAWRAGHEPEDIVAALLAKYAKNRDREWPDWKTADPDGPIEHIKAGAGDQR